MGQAILKPRFLNLDKDSRVIASNEMLSAFNVRVTSDNGDAGVVKNIKGNSALLFADSMPSGTNSVVGAYNHAGTDRVFFFYYNSNDQHTVWELSHGSTSMSLVVSNSALGDGFAIESDSFLNIDGILVKGDLILYFNDGVNGPQKVNVDNGVTLETYPRSQFEALVVKASPEAPSVAFGTDTSFKKNNIIGKSFQFAWQYIYRDGEVSAIGEYSDNEVSLNTLNSFNGHEGTDYTYNKIDLALTLPSGFVSAIAPKVNLLFRGLNDNTMYFVEEYDIADAIAGVEFTNSGVYSVVADAEYNKLQDSVPKTAQAQVMKDNRLFYANYTEGFDKQTIASSMAPTYLPDAVNLPLDFTIASATSEVGLLDASGVTASLNGHDLQVNLDITLDAFSVTDTTGRDVDLYVDGALIYNMTGETIAWGTDDYRITKSFSVSNSTPASILTDIASGLNNTVVSIPVTSPTTETILDGGDRYDVTMMGTSSWTIAAVVVGTDIQLTFNLNSYHVDGGKVVSSVLVGSLHSVDSLVIATGVSMANIAIAAFAVEDSNSFLNAFSSIRTFKAGEGHSLGVVFEDKYKRTSGVYELGETFVPHLSERALGSRGATSITSTLTVTDTNSEFTNFFYVYGGGDSYSNFVQYSVGDSAYASASGSVEEYVETDNIFLSMRTLQGKKQSFCSAQGGDIAYEYSEGDRLRVISHLDAEGVRIYPTDITFEVNELITIDDHTDSGSILAHHSATNKEFRLSGAFLSIKNESHAGWSVTDVQTDGGLWEDDVIVEIYTPRPESDNVVYRACSPKFPVSDLGSAQVITNGNAWWKPRFINFLVGAQSKNLVGSSHAIESLTFSDSDGSSKGFMGGKPYGVIKNESENSQQASITYSDVTTSDSAVNYLSSFNNSQLNFVDYDAQYGGIFGLASSGNNITVLQSNKVSVVPVSQGVLMAGSDNLLVSNTEILGKAQAYPSDFGIGSERSAFLNVGNSIFIVDLKRGLVMETSPQGVKNISDAGVSSYIESRSEAILGASNGGFVSLGYSQKYKEVILNLMQDNGSGLVHEKAVVFSRSLGKWTSFMDFSSKNYTSLGNVFISSNGSNVYTHETSATYGSFYGTTFPASITSVINAAGVNRSVFNAIGVDATAPISATVSTLDQSVPMPEAAFALKEGVRYAQIPKEEGQAQFSAIGKVASVDTTTVTMENPINRLPFRLGGDVYKISGTDYVSVSDTIGAVISRNVASFAVGNVAAGDRLAIKGASVDGESMRGHYMEVALVIDSTTETELYAMTVHYSDSSLHHTTQQQG